MSNNIIMKEKIKRSNNRLTLLTALIILSSTIRCFSQVSVTGPVCVMQGTTYSYKLTGTWYSSSTMQICVKGGVIGGSTDSCSGNGVPVAIASVTWNTPGAGKLIITTSTGNTSLDVNIISPLVPGDITQTSKTQNIGYNAAASLVDCTPATGGNCSPSYVYEWQLSDNNVIWAPVPGATGKSVKLTGTLKKTTYLRRKVTETKSGMIAYSNPAIVFVDVDRTGHN